ncbi:YidH family protein [Citreimonas salinaria]|uniref:Putative membrane protein n=1 Tax=Citreimonas salinaria TaxID=321339 RepID=A0A1H3KA50_9RHOB|nr:DUF202 domain-containing protein [Citreimonas salinaria]SDY48665.1 putative membrane protein [Citreimonas salinaria]
MDDAPEREREGKTELAKDRTDWAEDRTVLANERTFASWIRSGLAAVAVALGLHALFRDFEPTWVPKMLANIFILTAIAIFVAAWRGAMRMQKRMKSHDTGGPPRTGLSAITAVLIAVSLATGVVLWLL